MAPLLALALSACGPRTSDSGTAPTSGSLRLLTYNVAGLPTGLAKPERPTTERMERIAPLLPAYDWIGLQEDFTEEGHAALWAEAPHPVQAWFSERAGEDRFYGSGLSALVRGARLVEVQTHHYSRCNGVIDGSSDCLASKGFLVLTLSLGGATLDLLHTHHDAGGGPEDAAARAAQVDEVVDRLQGESAGRAVVFVGDFNMAWSDPVDAVELQKYADTGLRDACLELGCPDPDRIDRIWVRDGEGLVLEIADWSLEPGFVDEDGLALSDHEPVALTLTWRRR